MAWAHDIVAPPPSGAPSSVQPRTPQAAPLCTLCLLSSQALVYADLYGAARGPAAYGLERLLTFPLVFLGAPMVGALFEATGNYTSAAVVCGVSQLCGAALYALLHTHVRHAYPPPTAAVAAGSRTGNITGKPPKPDAVKQK